jgi:ABC transport system ATP-binding/permease protein
MSTYLQIDGVSRIYGEKVLFNKVSFQVNEGQKIALIAKNGTGKTTLLNIIAGKDSPDEGQISIDKHIQIGYLLQEPELNLSQSIFDEVYHSENDTQAAIKEYEKALISDDKVALQNAMAKMDALNAWEFDTRIKQVLSIMKIEDLDQKVESLSGGQKKRVALAKVLISEPDLLILDEPTNHLDLDMIEWLEEYLTRNRLSLLMVTHDRYFLDRVCNEIIELDGGQVYQYKGNYSYFVEKKAAREQVEAAEVDKARNLLRTEQDWMNRMPKARSTKAKYRIDNYYELKTKAANVKNEGQVNINIAASRLGNKILEMKDVGYSWGDMPILDGFTYNFSRFEKVGILGKNGSGKSTFLDVITGKLQPQSGTVQKGETIKFGYYKQQGIAFQENTKVIDVVREIADVVTLGDGQTVSAAQFLNYFLFPFSMHYNYVGKLSGGEKRRLYLVTVLMQSPNFLILDEPTNDLDIFTLNVLEEYLAAFGGCVMVVSHDRYFMDKIVDHLFVFEGNAVVKDFPGNYTLFKDYSDQLKKESIMQSRQTEEKKTEKPKGRPSKQKLSFKEKLEYEGLEKEIAALEAEKTKLEGQMNSGNLSADELTGQAVRHGEITALIDEKTMRWMELDELA